MNSMTEKRSFNRVPSVTGALLLFSGIVCFIVKAFSAEYIDAAGVLHEKFFLLPAGFSLIFAGLIVLMGVGIKTFIYKIRKGEQR